MSDIMRIAETLAVVAAQAGTFEAEVSGLRHLGAGVAFVITSPALQSIRAVLKAEFVAWLGSQDMQKWQPHITIQNKVPRAKADALYRDLSDDFRPYTLQMTGLDLWDYLDGPWRHAAFAPFGAGMQTGRDDPGA